MPQERGATIQTVGPQNLAQTLLGLKGGDVPQNILVPDLLGVIELGRKVEPELQFDQSILPWSVQWTQAAVAAQFGIADIAESPNHLIVVMGCFHQDSGNTSHVCYHWSDTAVAAAAQPVFSLDTRFGLNPGQEAGAPIINVNTVAGIAANIFWRSRTINAQSPSDLPPPVILGPNRDPSGNHLQITMDVVNVAFNLTLWGYSIPVRPQ